MNKSVNDIINALGGTGNLASLLGVKPSAVSNYRKKGFPARLHLKIISLCEEYSIPIDNVFFDNEKIPFKSIKSKSSEVLTKTSHSILNNLTSDGYELIDPPVLVSADKVLDRLGEAIADRLYIFSQQDGIRLCLRPDLTIPTCLYYLDQGLSGEKRLFSYFGKVFQFYGEESNEPVEYTQTGIESIGDSDKNNADIEDFVKIQNALTDEGIKIFSLDQKSALELVRWTIKAFDTNSYAGSSIEEITDRLRKKGEAFSLKPLSKNTKDLIKGFLSISDRPLQALEKLRKLCLALDESLIDKIDETLTRFEIIQKSGVGFKNTIFTPEKGRDVEYYSGFLFDFVWKNNNESLYIGGGGRYDNLIKSLGSKNKIPAVGAALNIKRIERLSQIERLRWALLNLLCPLKEESKKIWMTSFHLQVLKLIS